MFKQLLFRLGAIVACLGFSAGANAAFHLWQVSEMYSNSDGTIQFIRVTALAGGQQFLAGHTLRSTENVSGAFNTFTFPANLPGDTTGKSMLIGTTGFAALGVVTPDYTIPNGFLHHVNGGIFNFAEGADQINFTGMPINGKTSFLRGGGTALNAPKNFAGATGTVLVPQRQDFNRDQRSDILWHNDSSGSVFQMQMMGFTVGPSAVIYTEPDLNWKIVATGDLNGDGRADLVWQNGVTGGVFVMLMNGAAILGGQVVYTEPDTTWKIVAAGDFNGDGKADLLWRNSVGGSVFVQLMNGFTVTGGSVIYTEPDQDWKIVGVGDTDLDGKADIIWRHQAGGGEVFVMRMNGTTIAAGQFIYSESNTAWSIVKTADLNGDGRTDLVWRNSTTGDVFGQLLNGFTVTGGAVLYSEAAVWEIVATGDYNADGRADLLWRNSTTGQVFMMQMNGAAIQAGQFIYTEPDTNWKILGP
jgi:hypothetical protein